LSDLPPGIIDLAAFRNKDARGPDPAETLLLVKAFMRIKDPKQRAAVMAMIEKILAEQDA
jgi:hypothetical protein